MVKWRENKNEERRWATVRTSKKSACASSLMGGSDSRQQIVCSLGSGVECKKAATLTLEGAATRGIGQRGGSSFPLVAGQAPGKSKRYDEL